MDYWLEGLLASCWEFMILFSPTSDEVVVCVGENGITSSLLHENLDSICNMSICLHSDDCCSELSSSFCDQKVVQFVSEDIHVHWEFESVFLAPWLRSFLFWNSVFFLKTAEFVDSRALELAFLGLTRFQNVVICNIKRSIRNIHFSRIFRCTKFVD